MDTSWLFTPSSDVAKRYFPVVVFIESAIDRNGIKYRSDVEKTEHVYLHSLESYVYL